MCAILIGVPAGKPDRLTTNVAVPAVMLPAASFVTSKVTVALPLPLASAPVIAGTSFAGDSCAVNVGLVGLVGVGEVDELHPIDPTASRAARTERRFIVTAPCQKNLRVRLKPRLSVFGFPPWAICPNVVPGLFVNVSANTCPPTRFSIAKANCGSRITKPPIRGDTSPSTFTSDVSRSLAPRPTNPVSRVGSPAPAVLWTQKGSAYTARREPTLRDTTSPTAGEEC